MSYEQMLQLINPPSPGAGVAPPSEIERSALARVLDDHEIAAVWHAAQRQGRAHGTLVQFLMLTALRRNEAAELRRSEVVEGVIRLPPERMKTSVAFTLPLSVAAAGLLASCPATGEYFFPAKRDASKPFTAWSHEKSKLNALLNVEHWVIHDLRRTAATLMERAEVLPHVIEACLNHTIPGVAGVYRRHNFAEEKKAALEALATLMLDIVGPSPGP